MEIVLLIGVAAYLFIMTMQGQSKGCIKMVLSLGITIVAMVGAGILSKPCETYVKEKTPLYDTVKKQMSAYVFEYLEQGMETATEQMKQDAIQQMKLPEVIKDKLLDSQLVQEQMGADTANQLSAQINKFSDAIAETLTDYLLQALTLLVLYIVLKLVLKIVVWVLDIVSHLPVIHGLNKSLGAAIGFGEGILVVWIICIGITACGGTAIGANLLKAIANQPVLSYIYNHNLLMLLL